MRKTDLSGIYVWDVVIGNMQRKELFFLITASHAKCLIRFCSQI